jgi:hypothetical protein
MQAHMQVAPEHMATISKHKLDKLQLDFDQCAGVQGHLCKI